MTTYTYPAQCKCGHLFLERFQFPQPTDKGVVGFCWCGFCRTRLNVHTDNSFKEVEHA